MVKELVVYPDDRIVMCGDVRGFDESVGTLFDDMRETMQTHGLQALSAIQVAHPFNMILIFHDGRYHEYVNLRLLEQKDRAPHTESTSYFPGIEYTVPRYRKLRIFYEDRYGKEHYEQIDDPELAATLQRKLDFTSGATPLFRLPQKERDGIIRQLEGQGLYQPNDLCPTFSRKDYITSFTDKILFFMGLSLLTPLFSKFFHWSAETISGIYTFDKIAFPLVLVLMVIYFFYAQYEAKKYRQCSSCQIGNQIGIIAKRTVAAVALALGAWLLVNPASPIFS